MSILVGHMGKFAHFLACVISIFMDPNPNPNPLTNANNLSWQQTPVM